MTQNTAGSAEKSVLDMTPGEAKSELAKREADKMTRRAALAKVGIRTGMAIFAAFSIDDLARKAATVLSQRSQDNVVVDKLACELHGAGVAFADEVCFDENGNSTPCGTSNLCDDCVQRKLNCLSQATTAYLTCVNTPGRSQAYCDCLKINLVRDCRCQYHACCTYTITPSGPCVCGQTDCPPVPNCGYSEQLS